MPPTESVLKKIQERIHEKDEVIEAQMEQLLDLEDKFNAMKEEFDVIKGENERLKNIKKEYDELKDQLDSLLNG